MTQASATRKPSPAPQPSPEKGTPQEALRRATEIWSRGDRLEMAALADSLGVTRVTLFRWMGNRDELVAEILWSQWSLLWTNALATVEGRGPPYVAGVCRRVMSGILQSQGMRSFLKDDPEYALRMLTSKSSPVQQRVIECVRKLLTDQISQRSIDPPIEVDALAYAMVRIVESFIYSDQIAGRQPDVEIPAQILLLLLRPDTRRRSS